MTRFLNGKSAVFLGGAIAGLALAACLFAGKAEAQRALGHYSLTRHSNPNAIAGVFRLNESTGYVSYCYLDTSGKPLVTCTQETP